MLTRREQLQIRASSKAKTKGDGKGGKGKGGKGKTAGKGNGKAKGKGKGKKKTGKGKAAGKGKSRSTKTGSKDQGQNEKLSEVGEHEETEVAATKPKRKRTPKVKEPENSSIPTHPGSEHAVIQPRKKKRENGPAASSEPESKAADKSRKPRKIATPQSVVQLEDPVEKERFEGLIKSLKQELYHHWKSGKTNLTLADCSPQCFERSTLSCYFTRSRPAIGLKVKGHCPRTNKEYAYFSFNLKDVCNVGFAMRCAVEFASNLKFKLNPKSQSTNTNEPSSISP